MLNVTGRNYMFFVVLFLLYRMRHNNGPQENTFFDLIVNKKGLEAFGKRSVVTLNHIDEVLHLINVCKLVARRKGEVDGLD